MNKDIDSSIANRREFIKTGLCALGASAIALSGCDKKDNAISSDDNITPKQTGTYEFSCPLPFDYKTIDDIVTLNSTLKKSKITALYNSAPMPLVSKFNKWVQVPRGENRNIKNYDDFGKYIKYAMDNGFKFTYLMNSPKVFSENDLTTFKNDFLYLVDFLKNTGVKHVKVGTIQICSLLQELAPDEFILSASTTFEFQHTVQYKNLFEAYPNFDLIDASNSQNQNFNFLKALRKQFPKIKIELMVNEACIKGCPARIAHLAEPHSHQYNCYALMKKYGRLTHLFKTGVIYPWNIEYYSAIGINNFKFLGNAGKRADFSNLKFLETYLSYLEGEQTVNLNDFIGTMFNRFGTPLTDNKKFNKINIAELKQYFPDINFFIKNGHDCSDKCGIDCFYCDECAKKLEKFINS